jgi:HEAT repeat protein
MIEKLYVCRALTILMFIAGCVAAMGCGNSNPAAQRGDKLSEHIAQLKHADPTVRQEAAEQIRLMGTEGTKEALPHLIANFNDEHQKVREWASEAVSVYGEDAVEPLVEAAQSDQPRIRAMVYYSFGNLHPLVKMSTAEKVVPILGNALRQEKDREARVQMAYALNRYAGVAFVTLPDQIKAIQEDPDKFVRCWLIDGIGKMGPRAKEAVPVLEKLFENPDQEISGAADKALYWILEKDKEFEKNQPGSSPAGNQAPPK